MKTNRTKSEKRKFIAYWVVTGLLATAMFFGGLAQFMQFKFNTDGFIRLGYPLYTMKLIGGWKMVGVIALLIPGYALVKEWTYAGYFFLLTGAVISHVASGDGIPETMGSFTFAILTVVSWYLRPANRKLGTTNEPTSRQRTLASVN